VSRFPTTHPVLLTLGLLLCVGNASANADDSTTQASVREFLVANCLDCHNGEEAEAGLDLSAITFELRRRDVFDRWVLIHDYVRDGEMPPPDGSAPIPIAEHGWSSTAVSKRDTESPDDDKAEARAMLKSLASLLANQDQRRIADTGRSKVRRLNRFEYENAVRGVLDAPWLQIAEGLPEDGIEHLFNKSGERLDVSHVQLMRLLEVSEQATRLAVDAAAHPSRTRRFYAREEPTIQNYVHFRFGQRSATRSIVPLVDFASEPDVIRMKQPITVGDADPEKRNREAMGVFCGVYSATTKYDFTRVNTPTDGHYRLRFKTYTFMAGPNGASGGDDHGLTGGNKAWWRPDRNVILEGRQIEPVTLYALAPSGDSRWLTTFDSQPEPTVFECVVSLRKGEGIRPDAARLVRTRPGWSGNPNATQDGVPGFAMNWLEVEGPLNEIWPPKSYSAVFGDLRFEVSDDGHVRAISNDAETDARILLTKFQQRCGLQNKCSIDPFVRIFKRATELGDDFTDAMIAAVSAMLSSPDFLYFDAQPGPLDDDALRQRLAYFLWNGPPDRGVNLSVDAMLGDPRSNRFVDAFLDYWLDLRDINANTPDASLYPDYYLDELLTESSVLETRMFFRELIEKDLPIRNLVDSDFTFVNERLAEHYGLAVVPSVKLRRVTLPVDSPRGGLLTQASVLRVTANGTTTSPVVRGAWIMERLLGTDIPPPPSGVDAVEPDIRGAKTIREQLDKHRSIETCNACHAKFDPAGIGLESFDVTGGWRDRYRSLGNKGQSVAGFGMNGHTYEFKLAQPIDCAGKMRSGESFSDVRELKKLLASDERQLARNFSLRMIAYATGAPVTFGDRATVEKILDEAQPGDYGVRSLIHALVRSDLFRNK
jgi:hypothetical protein